MSALFLGHLRRDREWKEQIITARGNILTLVLLIFRTCLQTAFALTSLSIHTALSGQVDSSEYLFPAGCFIVGH